jgi:acetyl esterase/lipase
MPAPNPAYAPTLYEKLDIVPGLLSLLGAGVYAAIAAPFRGEWGADTYKHHITHSVVRKMVSRFSTAQLQFISPPFGVLYTKWCKANGVNEEAVELVGGCKGFWMGDKAAKYTVIYFHGGGFSLDGDDTHLNYWNSIQKDLASADKSVSFLFVEYTLVPHGTYPVQFQEGVSALQYVLDTVGKKPSEIILSGDSAGGNMSLALLSHLMHPSPDAPVVKISEPLKALVLVAPWVSFRTDWPSATKNAYKDIIYAKVGRMWGMDYLGGKPSTPYTEALNAPEGWWKDSGKYVEGIISVCGSDEMLVDPIELWVKAYKVYKSPLCVVQLTDDVTLG